MSVNTIASRGWRSQVISVRSRKKVIIDTKCGTPCAPKSVYSFGRHRSNEPSSSLAADFLALDDEPLRRATPIRGDSQGTVRKWSHSFGVSSM